MRRLSSKRRRKRSRLSKGSPLRSQRGAAIILAIFSLAIMIYLAVQVAYDTQVEYLAATQQVNRIKAYYAAKAGVEISLLRISLYKKALAGLGGTLGDGAQSILDPIWQLPFAWPPIMPEDLNAVDKDSIQTTVKESLMEATYVTTIEGEGGKIDINDLASPSEDFAKKIRQQLFQVFETEKENNEEFNDQYENYNFDELLNNIADWVDENKDSRNGASENDPYVDREKDNAELPPNQPFKTLDELHMVAGMDDTLFSLLSKRVTVYGTKGINVNTASPELLRSLDPQITDEVLAEIEKRRSDPAAGGPFKNEEDFFSFLRSNGMRTDRLAELEIPFIFDAEFNFRVVSFGKAGTSKREITVITFDVDNLTESMVKILNESKPQQNQGGTNPSNPPQNPGSGGSNPAAPKKTYKSPKGAPTVVFWQET